MTKILNKEKYIQKITKCVFIVYILCVLVNLGFAMDNNPIDHDNIITEPQYTILLRTPDPIPLIAHYINPKHKNPITIGDIQIPTNDTYNTEMYEEIERVRNETNDMLLTNQEYRQYINGFINFQNKAANKIIECANQVKKLSSEISRIDNDLDKLSRKKFKITNDLSTLQNPELIQLKKQEKENLEREISEINEHYYSLVPEAYYYREELKLASFDYINTYTRVMRSNQGQ